MKSQTGWLQDKFWPLLVYLYIFWLPLSQDSAAESSTAMTGMEGIFDDDDDMLIQASSKVAEDGDNFVDNDDDDADSIDLGAIKKSIMPLIIGDEDSNAAGVCGISLKKNYAL